MTKPATVTVVRIERDKLGPWAGEDYGSKINRMLNRRFGSKRHTEHGGPTVYRADFEDDDTFSEQRFVYGCQSYEDLVAYFGIKIIRSLLKRGFEIKTYTVDWRAVRFGKGELVVKGSAIYGRDYFEAEWHRGTDEKSDNPFRYRNGYTADSVMFNEMVMGDWSKITGVTTV